MHAIDVIRSALLFADEGFAAFVEGLRPHSLVRSCGYRGNHALWTMGHLAYFEGDLPRILLGEPNIVAHYEPLFAPGTETAGDPSCYPSFDELLRTLRGLRRRTVELLDRIGADGLDCPPTNIPPGFEREMRTCGDTFHLLALHQMMHLGQVTDMRRVAGLPYLQSQDLTHALR